MPAKHDELWARLRAALANHGALPPGNATPGEIAKHANSVLPTASVGRFGSDYFYKKAYSATDRVLTDAEAEVLVTQVETMPIVKPTPTRAPAQKNRAAAAPPHPTAKPPSLSKKPQESQGFV